jgi:cell division septum initiation protein DivIVA
MAEKNFLTWLGFKGESSSAGSQTTPRSESASPSNTSTTQPSSSAGASVNTRTSTPSAGTSNATFERIRELEAELADLRARRDITSLTKEEFEILATETATSLIKAAQARESQARSAAERALEEAGRAAKNLIESAELKARTTLQSAEGRGRKYLEAAEHEAKEAIEKATNAAREMIESKQREASGITSAAKREADRVISEATSEIAHFKNWLGEAIAESDRLHKLQTQALAAAEEGIKNSRAKLTSAFEKLASLGTIVESALDENHHPKEKEFGGTSSEVKKSESAKPAVKKATAVKPESKRPTAGKTQTKRAVSTSRKSTSKTTKRK